ncbi:amino acid permease [Caulobacter rhizosphaerae]|jgi:APA family basic amino acid/polyamine antiporter|uniref:Arginine/agmatine antiporter n=1 Tax=Caulobacter rhizosphaerae TaxID=2010972 RepID=A0ABU1N722_9CAUL|nr:amino acid permease [Caulobacter rhizosphaerae]MDR6533835.1 APA family basic amino acid/polyamine antiporter [Caulobacter rhizosphaerae]GGL46657.1 amino acid permease [Caulobacter rhizosphaerae]
MTTARQKVPIPKITAPRALGFWMCTALVIGNMIGSGVFMLPASLAPYGWNAVFGWLLTIGGALCLAVVFAGLAREFPKAGGPYAYTQEAFGPLVGFMVAWSYWISLWVGNAAIATGAVSYLSAIFPAIARVPGMHLLITLGAVWLLVGVNIAGARLAGGVQVATTVLKLLPLVAVAGLAFWVIGRDHGASLTPFRASDIHPGGITAAGALTLWALLGLESATVPAGKVVDPVRTIPRATLVGTVFTGVIYLLVCSAVVLLTPADALKVSNAPLADFVSLHWGGGAGKVLALFAAISAFGALNGWVLLQGEMPYAMARGGVFPAFLAKESTNGAPVRAHLLSAGFLTVLVLMNYAKSMADLFTFIALVATTASLFAYLACALAALKLQATRRIAPTTALTVIAILAGLYSVWTLVGAGGEAVLLGLGLLVVGAPFYWLTRGGSFTSNPPGEGRERRIKS